MAFRSEKICCGVAGALLALAPGLYAQPEFRYEVRHDHWRKFCTGTLRIDENGVSYRESPKKKKAEKDLHAWSWSYQDIQELEIAPKRIRVVSYKDNKWKLGADREYDFAVVSGDPAGAYTFLRDRLDQRFVAALADQDVKPLWQIPVKHLRRIHGSEGVLVVSEERIVYRTDEAGESRTWRLKDIDNISSSGPFQLTMTTYERAKSSYGSLKGFNFQLKEPLDEERYNRLWRRLNQSKGLKILTSYREKETTQ